MVLPRPTPGMTDYFIVAPSLSSLKLSSLNYSDLLDALNKFTIYPNYFNSAGYTRFADVTSMDGGSTYARLKDIVNNYYDSIRTIGSIPDDIFSIPVNAWQSLKKMPSLPNDFWSRMGDLYGNAININSLVSKIPQLNSLLGEASFLNQIYTGFGISNFWTQIQALYNQAATLIALVTDAAVSLPSALQTKITAIVNSIISGIRALIDNAVAYIKSVEAKAKGFITEVQQRFISIQNIAKAGFTNVQSDFTGMTNRINEAIKGLGDVPSPPSSWATMLPGVGLAYIYGVLQAKNKAINSAFDRIGVSFNTYGPQIGRDLTNMATDIINEAKRPYTTKW